MLPPSVQSGNAIAACVAGLGAAGAVTNVARPCSYLACSVASYCWRRGNLHKRRDGVGLGAAEVLRRHLQYEDEWHLPAGSPLMGRLQHVLRVAAWLLLFQPVYPILECVLYPLDRAAFFFYYPRARGCGLVIDSRARRRNGERGAAAQVFRLDWHQFHLNTGKAYPPPNTGRHPPSVRFNLPHVDLPQRSVRHWPWRQHTDALLLPWLPRSPDRQRK